MDSLLNHVPTEQQAADRIAELRTLSEVPAVLYGAGVYAHEVRDFLRFLDIEVRGCFVDDEFISTSHGEAIPVATLDRLASEYPTFDVVLAFCGDPRIALEKLAGRRCPGIRNVQVVDCRFWRRFRSFRETWRERHADALQKVYDLLDDGRSKQTFAAFLEAKIAYTPVPLADVSIGHQYFPRDLPAFMPRPDDVFIDCGAYTGDTLETVVKLTGGAGCRSYYAYEPDDPNAAALRGYVDASGVPNVHIIRRGLWSSQATMRFAGARDPRSTLSAEGDAEIEVDTIDRLGVAASFIKFDIEGAEYEALKGAEETVRRHRPNLAVAVYHRPEDLWEVPLFLKALCPDYRLHLRLHSLFSEELILYATARDAADVREERG